MPREECQQPRQRAPGCCSLLGWLRRWGTGLPAWSCMLGAQCHCLSSPPGLSFMPLQIWSKALAILGILTMGLALLGCVGALKELPCLLGLVSAPSPLQPWDHGHPPSNRALAAPDTQGGARSDLSTLLPSTLGSCCSCSPRRSPWESSSPLRGAG